MQYISGLVFGMAILPFTHAIPQASSSLSGLPACVASGALTAVQSAGCSLSDTACFCKSSSFMQQLQTLAEQNCSATDLQTAISLAQNTCASAGVALTTDTTTVTPAAATSTPSDSSDAAAAATAETDDASTDNTTPDEATDDTDTAADPSSSTTSTATAATAAIIAPYAMANMTDDTDCSCTTSTSCATSPSNTGIAIFTGAAIRISLFDLEAYTYPLILAMGILGLSFIA